MRLIACLCWYDERVAMLRRCVRSLAGVADGLVALDGPFSAYPNAAKHPRSPAAQERAVIESARDAGIPACVEGRDEPWETQLTKRTYMMRRAVSYFGATRDDWLLVIDADERAVARPDFHAKLERVPEVKLVALVRGESDARQRRLFRALPDIRLEASHNGYRVADLWLAGNSADGPLAPTADLSGALSLEHDRRQRVVERNKRANLYRLARREAGER